MSLAASSGPKPRIPIDQTVHNRCMAPVPIINMMRVYSFVEPKELKSLEEVNTTFQNAYFWFCRAECQRKLGLGWNEDPDSVLPEGMGYRRGFHYLWNHMFDETFYERYVGSVEKASQAVKYQFLQRYHDPDSCDRRQKLGEMYDLVYLPKEITVQRNGVSLKIAVTINNLPEIFATPKRGNPSTYSQTSNKVIQEHGDKQMQGEWVCMRRQMIEGRSCFYHHLGLAKNNGVEPTELLPRILFNFLSHVRTKQVGNYPDNKSSHCMYACVSTPTKNSDGKNWISMCGDGDESGLLVTCWEKSADWCGLAVQLPAKVLSSGAFSLRLSSFDELFTEDERKSLTEVVNKNNEAIELCKKRDLYAAEKIFLRCLELCKNCSDPNLKKRALIVIHKNLSLIFQSHCELARAEVELREALNLVDHSDFDSWFNLSISLAHVLQGQGEIKLANDFYMDLSRKYDQFTSVKINELSVLAQESLKRGEKELHIQLMAKIRKYSQIAEKKVEEELENYRRDLDVFSQFFAVSHRYFYLGKLYALRRDYAEKINACMQAALDSSTDPAFQEKCRREFIHIGPPREEPDPYGWQPFNS